MIQVGIVGGTGYVAGELIRILMYHPEVNIRFAYSHSHAGEEIRSVHEDLFVLGDQKFAAEMDTDVDVVFLSLGHGHSTKFLHKHSFSAGTKIIDLSNDFRLKENSRLEQREFIYGLVEKNRTSIASSENVANPGCFATAIQLGLLPLANQRILHDDIHIHGITGSTGAGRALSETSHFSWRNNNISVYKPFVHQHLDEIKETLLSCQPEFDMELNFIPLRGDFTRGILATIYTECDLSEQALVQLYKDYYKEKMFTVVSDLPIHLKQVVNTNYCLLHVEKHGSKALIVSAIDNLLKGAAGQAVENMNLMFGFAEGEGLKLKPSYF
jgi:N-acetyl-gamma-glutamyl-phosphate reductase